MDKNKARYWLILIILAGLLLRLYKIGSPILDLYPTRQEQCAMIARNFFRHGYNIFHPQVDWFGNLDSSWRIELPITSYLAAIFYRIFSIHEFLGRIVNIFFSLGSIYLIFKLVNRVLNIKTALYAAFLFAISPLSIYFSRVFMSDITMIFFSLSAIYHFYKWTQLDKGWSYLWALISISLACLVKLPTLYLFLPLGYMVYSKYRNRVILRPILWAFFILPIFISFLWYATASDNLFIWIFKKPSYEYLIHADFYRRIFENLSIFVLTPLGALLSFLGLLLPVSKKEGYLLHLWLFAVVMYTFITAGPSYVHYHYQLPFVPIFCIFAAKAITKFTELDIWKHTLLAKINTNITVGVTLLIMTAVSFLSIRPFYNWNTITYRAAKVVNETVGKGAVVICGRSTQQAPLYYIDKKGWETNEEPAGSLSYSWAANLNKYRFPKKDNEPLLMQDEPELIKFLIKYGGADYYFTVNLSVLKQEPGLRDFLYKNFKVVQDNQDYILFDLRKTR